MTAFAPIPPLAEGPAPPRESLAEFVYARLRAGLMAGAYWPGHRFKIRDLARELMISETPVREALMQLVRERGLDMHAGRAITVARLSLAQYLELREIRLELEGLAAERAVGRITSAQADALIAANEALIAAERTTDWRAAVWHNWRFHHTLCRAAAMPELLAIIEGIWLRIGPLLNYLYPHAHPTYAGRHQHLNVIDALARGDAAGVREAIRADMIEGGTGLIRLLEEIEAGRLVVMPGLGVVPPPDHPENPHLTPTLSPALGRRGGS